MINDQVLFEKYANKILALAKSSNFEKDRIISPDFLIEKETVKCGNLAIYYIPFEYINENAKVILIGITPGWTQMEIAYRTVGQDLIRGLPLEQIFLNADKQASFAGTMRVNLINMLDELGLHKALHINSCSSLFSDNYRLAHTTSAIRYPVFVNGENYTGHKPDIVNNLILRKYLKQTLAKEIQIVDNALVIPLGKSVSEALDYLVEQRLLSPDRCLFDFPHPSGANGHRKRQFETMKPILKQKITNWFD